MTRRLLPIGIQTFRKIREGARHYYVDKTGYLQRLAEEGTHYFLSRPRRFGKSLLVDTLKELFEGNEQLFEGLQIHNDWDWSIRHPVMRFDFGAGNFMRPGYLDTSLAAQFDAMERRAGIRPRYSGASERLGHLIRSLHEKTGRSVVILFDEYDKPIVDALANPELARANRDDLRGLYATLKSQEAAIRFTFLTGVSKFSKVSLFSGLNNLTDITLDPRYSGICGYTDIDLNTVFSPELAGLDRQAVRDWYNGYGWRGSDRLYNPYDILLLFRNREFGAYWFETGTPSFLIETLIERGLPTPALDRLMASSDLLSTFDVNRIETEALLFQTGYLTIKGEDNVGGSPVFRLGYPNREVRQSLNESLLRSLAPNPSRQLSQNIELRRLLDKNDFDGLESLFRALFSSIPYEWHTKNNLANYEGYYASVLYSHIAAAGLDVTVEDSSSLGKVDMAIRHNAQVYLLEFKLAGSEPQGRAMAQLREKRYADKYRHGNRPIHLIAVEFSGKSRNVTAFAVERA